MNIKQLFFDCDNTLAQTEGLAFTVTAGLVNELMESKGFDERYTGEKLISFFIGQTFKGMMPLLGQKHEFTLTAKDVAHFIEREEEEVIGVIKEKGKPCVGVMEVLEKLRADGKFPMAVVSSSSTRRITATLKKTNQIQYFGAGKIYSAQTSLPKPKGKPEPDIYLHALKELGVNPEECLTVEDSRIGVIAAMEAGIPCIGYVGCYTTKAKQEQLEADFDDLGVVATMHSWSEFMGILEKMTSK
jgi:HAD superfamily hydrolase (TIGR01509 family)